MKKDKNVFVFKIVSDTQRTEWVGMEKKSFIFFVSYMCCSTAHSMIRNWNHYEKSLIHEKKKKKKENIKLCDKCTFWLSFSSTQRENEEEKEQFKIPWALNIKFYDFNSKKARISLLLMWSCSLYKRELQEILWRITSMVKF